MSELGVKLQMKNISPGFNTGKNYIYLCLIEAEHNSFEQVYENEDIKIFNLWYHSEKVGVLFTLKNYKIISRAENHITVNKACGRGVLFWSSEVSVHGNDTVTLFTRYMDKYATEMT